MKYAFRYRVAPCGKVKRNLLNCTLTIANRFNNISLLCFALCTVCKLMELCEAIEKCLCGDLLMSPRHFNLRR